MLLGGCASNGLSDQERQQLYQDYVKEHKLEELQRITAFKFHGWRELDKRHLIISTTFKRSYFITLRSNCVELQFTQTIGINRSDSSLHAKFDSIFVPSFPQQKCFIKSIHKLTREQADEIAGLGKEKDQSKENESDREDSNKN